MPVNYADIRRCADKLNRIIIAPEPYASLPRSCDWLRRMTEEYCKSPFRGETHQKIVERVIGSVEDSTPSFTMVMGPVGAGKTTIAARIHCNLIAKALERGSSFNFAYSYVFLAQPDGDKVLFLTPIYHVPCSFVTNFYLLKERDARYAKRLAEALVKAVRQRLEPSREQGDSEAGLIAALLDELENRLLDHAGSLECENLACEWNPRLPHVDYKTLITVFEKFMLAYVSVFNGLGRYLRNELDREARQIADLVKKNAIVIVYDQVEGLERHVANRDKLVNLLADYFYALKDVIQNAYHAFYSFNVLLLFEMRAYDIVRDALVKMAPLYGSTGPLASILETVMPNASFEMLDFREEDAKALISDLLDMCDLPVSLVFTEDAQSILLSFTGLSPRAITQLVSQLLDVIARERIPLPMHADALSEQIFRVRYPRLYYVASRITSLTRMMRDAQELVEVIFSSTGEALTAQGLKPRGLRHRVIEGLRRLLASLGYTIDVVNEDRNNYSYAAWVLGAPNANRIGYAVRFVYKRLDRRQLNRLKEDFENVRDTQYNYVALLYRSTLLRPSAAPADPRIQYRFIDCDRRMPRLALYLLVKGFEEVPDILGNDEEATREFARFLSELGVLPKLEGARV